MDSPDAAVVDALGQIVRAGRAGEDVKALGAKLAKAKGLKEAFAPVARLFKWMRVDARRLVQTCLEQPADHPLHRAAAALVNDGVIDWTIYLPIASGQPKRVVGWLRASKVAPVVYAIERRAVLSVWSFETGQHVEDVKLVATRDGVADLVELPDGTLRGIATRKTLIERAPGAASFVKALELGELYRGFGMNADLSRIAVVQGDPVERDDGAWTTVVVHHVPERKKLTVEVPLTSLSSEWVRVGDRTLVAAGGRYMGGDDASKDTFALAVIDLETAALRLLPQKREVKVEPAEQPGAVRVSYSEEVREGDWVEHAWTVDIATGAESNHHEPEDDGASRYTFGDGFTYDRHNGAIAKDGATVGHYFADPAANRVEVAHDPRTGRFAFGMEDPASPVIVVAPFDSARVMAAPGGEPKAPTRKAGKAKR